MSVYTAEREDEARRAQSEKDEENGGHASLFFFARREPTYARKISTPSGAHSSSATRPEPPSPATHSGSHHKHTRV